jgi:hypothetical protein
VEGYFCRGFCEKRGADGGFLMVNLWWNAGEIWSENDHISHAKNLPHFSDLFFGLSRFGNWIGGSALAR